MIGEHWVDPYPELELVDRLEAADRDNRWEPFGETEVYANSGLWVADCPRVGCGGAEHLGSHPDSQFVGGLSDKMFRCSRCFAEASPIWSKQRRTIERILAERPYPQHRNWIPGVSIQDLEEANETPWHFSWTAPKTYTAGAVLTAADLNTYQRDNLLETAPAKAGVGLIVGTAANLINVRDPQYQRINTSETTASTSFTDLATSGPAVTTDTGTEAFVMWGASAVNDTAASDAVMGFAVTGASTIPATDNYIFVVSGTERVQASMGILVQLTAGSNTFTAKYRVEGNTGTWNSRFIIVMPVR